MEITLEDLAQKAAKEFIAVNGSYDMQHIKAEKSEKTETLFLQYLKNGLQFSEAEKIYSERERTKLWNNKKEKGISFVDVVYEKNMPLLLMLPKMIFSYKALDELEQRKDLLKLCALIIIKMHKDSLPPELELAIVHLPGNGNIVHAFIDVDYQWSDRAKRQIERFYPKMYERTFCCSKISTGWLFV